MIQSIPILSHPLFSKASPKKDVDEKPEQQAGMKEADRAASGPELRQHPGVLFARGSKKASGSPQRTTSKIKEKKHPFALYGWGEKQTDTGNQKTHNVCASASAHEVRPDRGPLLPRLSMRWAVGAPWVVWGPWKPKEEGSGPRKMEQTLVA